MAVISVDRVTKEYRLGALQGLKETVGNLQKRLLGRPTASRPLFKALDDVSFSVQENEVVGIIGHNGAGKSTLLKMLARISTPTNGSVEVNGRMAPLIEVGAGFVPDFTGRENIYLNASILGLSRREIDRKLEEIIEFAELSEFIDTPVKRYSSGMQVKLGFSIATSVDAEVLLVDEVLAVGDLAFQRKCFDRMESAIKKEGRTVLVVSHNIRQIQRLCDRVLLFDHGRIIEDGPPAETCNRFYEISDKRITEQRLGGAEARLNSTGEVDVEELLLLSEQGQPTDKVRYGENVTVRMRLHVNSPIEKPVVSVGVHTTDFLYLTTRGKRLGEVLSPGRHIIDCRIERFPFLPRRYALRLGLSGGDFVSPVFHGENLLPFSVVDDEWIGLDPSDGFVLVDCSFDVRTPAQPAGPVPQEDRTQEEAGT